MAAVFLDRIDTVGKFQREVQRIIDGNLLRYVDTAQVERVTEAFLANRQELEEFESEAVESMREATSLKELERLVKDWSGVLADVEKHFSPYLLSSFCCVSWLQLLDDLIRQITELMEVRYRRKIEKKSSIEDFESLQEDFLAQIEVCEVYCARFPKFSSGWDTRARMLHRLIKQMAGKMDVLAEQMAGEDLHDLEITNRQQIAEAESIEQCESLLQEFLVEKVTCDTHCSKFPQFASGRASRAQVLDRLIETNAERMDFLAGAGLARLERKHSQEIEAATSIQQLESLAATFRREKSTCARRYASTTGAALGWQERKQMWIDLIKQTDKRKEDVEQKEKAVADENRRQKMEQVESKLRQDIDAAPIHELASMEKKYGDKKAKCATYVDPVWAERAQMWGRLIKRVDARKGALAAAAAAAFAKSSTEEQQRKNVQQRIRPVFAGKDVQLENVDPQKPLCHPVS